MIYEAWTAGPWTLHQLATVTKFPLGIYPQGPKVRELVHLPFGKRLHNYGKSPCY